MNKLMKLGLAGAMTCFCGIGASAQQIDPITEAVLQNYADILASNPQDYQTLLERASQYYSMGQYDRALSDIEMALQYTPDKDTDYKLAELSLKSDILTAQNNFEGAIAASRAALQINPTSQSDLYSLGGLYLITDQPQEALKTFQLLQRESPRSQEAFYGMATANVKLGNYQDAEKLIGEIENLGKQSFVTYCRIGDLYADMGNVKEAATNYAIAYSMEDRNARPVQSMKLLAQGNPTQVMDALDGLIQTKPDNLSLNLLKAIVAYDAGIYNQAEKACKALAAEMDQDSPVVYRMMALSQLDQNKLSEAKESIGTAERLAPGNPSILLDKAEVLLTQDPEEAYRAASTALQSNPDDEGSLMLAAKSAILAGRHRDAQSYLNNVILGNPSNIEALLLRGYLNSDFLKDEKNAVADFTRAGNVQQDGKVTNLILAALGKAKSNKRLDAEGMISEAIDKAGNNKDDLYLIAVYYAQTGNLDKAKEFADKAIANGYANLYNLKTSDSPLLNLKPIRHLMGN